VSGVFVAGPISDWITRSLLAGHRAAVAAAVRGGGTCRHTHCAAWDIVPRCLTARLTRVPSFQFAPLKTINGSFQAAPSIGNDSFMVGQPCTPIAVPRMRRKSSGLLAERSRPLASKLGPLMSYLLACMRELHGGRGMEECARRMEKAASHISGKWVLGG
jgi:hypothetical protein